MAIEVQDQQDLERRLNAALAALGDTSLEARKKLACATIGHSRIFTACFGYCYCGRCGEQIGDNLSGNPGPKGVAIGHKCDECVANMKLMTWKDTYLVPDPFADEPEQEETRDVD